MGTGMGMGMGNLADARAPPAVHRQGMTITDDPTPPTTPATGTPLQAVQALYEAFGQGDLPGMLARIHPDVDWSTEVTAPGAELVPMFRNGRGHDAVMHYFSGVAALEFHVFNPVAFHEDGDVVLVELELAMTHRTTGKQARFGEIHRFVVRDGMVVHYRHFADTAALIDLYRS